MNSFLKKIRFYFRLFVAFWQKQRKIIILSLLFTIIGIGLLGFSLRTFAKKSSIRIGLVGKYSFYALPDPILFSISQGLSANDGSFTQIPGMAEKWDRSEDGREYVFTLKNDLYWHDGKKVTSQTLSYNFNDVAVFKPNDKQIKFTLKEPFAPFPAVVSKPIFKNNYLGTGEYKVKGITIRSKAIEKLVLVSTKPENDQIIYKFYPLEKNLKTAFKLGEIDVAKDLSNLSEMENWPGTFTSKTIDKTRFIGIFFNLQNPVFADKNLRQALAYAIQERWDNPAYSPISEYSWAYNKNVKKYTFDLAHAKLLLKKVGENGKGIDEITLSAVPSLMKEAELIKSDWEQLGVKVRVNTPTAIDNNFQALLISQEIPIDPDQYSFWHSTQPGNICHYKSPKIDKLLEDGRKTFDQSERKRIYADFQKYLVEDTPVIFLYYPPVYTISRK